MGHFDDIDAIMDAVRYGYITREQARELLELPSVGSSGEVYKSLTFGSTTIRQLADSYRQREIQRGLLMHHERESARAAYNAQRTSTDPYTNNRLADECQRLKDENASLRAQLENIKRVK